MYAIFVGLTSGLGWERVPELALGFKAALAVPSILTHRRSLTNPFRLCCQCKDGWSRESPDGGGLRLKPPDAAGFTIAPPGDGG